jgi:hypothetical protein
MVSRKQGIYGFISAAAIVSGILAGCGGSNSVSGLGGTVATTGGITTAPGTSATPVASSPSPQQVQVTTANGPITGTLPAGESIPANGSVATIPPGVPIIVGLTLSTAFHGRQTVPVPTATGGAKPASGSQGQVYVDGQNTGLTVDSSGDLSGYLILTPGTHTVTAFGPFTIVGGSGLAPTQLTVGVFNFGVPVHSDGIAAVPTNLNMKLPSNGGSWTHGPFVTVTYPTPDFASSAGTLIIVVDNARTITDGKVFTNGIATYNGFGNTFPGKSNIPNGGVQSVTFNVN